jgi:hypothetical protein
MCQITTRYSELYKGDLFGYYWNAGLNKKTKTTGNQKYNLGFGL